MLGNYCTVSILFFYLIERKLSTSLVFPQESYLLDLLKSSRMLFKPQCFTLINTALVKLLRHKLRKVCTSDYFFEIHFYEFLIFITLELYVNLILRGILLLHPAQHVFANIILNCS